MAPSSWLRSTANRLRFLSRPVPLATSFGLVLLAIFVWQYSRNPEQFNSYSPEDGPTTGENVLSGLTPAEQAAVAEIDNLTVLFNELGIESGGIPNIQALVEEQDGSLAGLNPNALALAQPTNSGNNDSNGSPFAQYLDQYEFSVQMPNASQSGATNNRFLGGNSAQGQRDQAADRWASPLAAALQNQATSAPAAQTSTNLFAAESMDLSLSGQGEARSPDGTDAAATTPAGESTDPLANYTGEFGSQAVTIPGVNFPVLPTLPQMSPPPGTTGYTPPITLDMMPPLPGTSRPSTSAFPSSGASSIVPSSSAPGTLNLTAPQVDVSNGYITPYTPTVPAAPTPTVTPAPFSAPRPPGSYTGGGYINTFSNPSTPR
jgi:hypothetical protein